MENTSLKSKLVGLTEEMQTKLDENARVDFSAFFLFLFAKSIFCSFFCLFFLNIVT